MQVWKYRHGSAWMENAGVGALECQTNTKGSSTEGDDAHGRRDMMLEHEHSGRPPEFTQEPTNFSNLCEDVYCVSLQDPASASNGGSTTPNAPTSGKKGKKSRGKDAATDSGNGDAGTAENRESVSSGRAVIFFSYHIFLLIKNDAL